MLDDTNELSEIEIDAKPLETEDDYADLIEEVTVTAKRGYGDRFDHIFFSEEHAALLKKLEPSADMSENEKTTRELNRSILRLQMAMDAKRLFQEKALENTLISEEDYANGLFSDSELEALTAQKLYTKSLGTDANPEDAVIEANIEADMPNVEEAVKKALFVYSKGLSLVSKRLEDRKLFSFGFDNYTADLLAHFPNPLRQAAGVAKFSQAQGRGWFGYFQLLNEWRELDAFEREQRLEFVEQTAWEAAGNNALVYGSLIMPFLDEGDEAWNSFLGLKQSLAIDAVDTALTASLVAKLFLTPARMAKTSAFLEKSLKASSRALKRGNVEEAAEATVKGIKAQDPAAVVDGSPLKWSTVDDTAVDGLAVPTKLKLEEKLVAEGKLAEGESLTINIGDLTDSERLTAAAKVRASLLEEETVLDVSEGVVTDKGVTFEIWERSTREAPVAEIKAIRKQVKDEIAAVKNELKAVVAGTDVGEEGATKESLVARLEELKLEDQRLGRAIKGATKKEGGVGKTVTMPSAEVKTVTWDWQVDEATGVGVFKRNHVGTYGHTIGTPETRLGRLHDSLVSLTALLRQQQRRVFGLFDKSVRQIQRRFTMSKIFSGFNTSEKEELEALLFTGDKLQKRFTDAELRSTIRLDDIGYVSLTDKQVAAYNEIRDMYDDLWILADQMKREELEFAGYRMFWANLKDGDGNVTKPVRVFAKTRDDAIQGSIPKVGDERIKMAVDSKTGEVVDLSTISDLNKGLEEGRYGFVELYDDLVMGGGDSYRYALVHNEVKGGIRYPKHIQPIDRALDYRRGYVPKLASERITHVVQAEGSVMRNGVQVADARLLRAFDSPREAEIYLNKWLADHPGRRAEIVDIAAQRGNEAYKRTIDEVDRRLYSGAFVGHRHENAKFLIGLEGREAQRINPFEALQRYADFVGVYYPMHKWKNAMIQRFHKMVRENGLALEIPTRWDSKLAGEGREGGMTYQDLKALQDMMKVSFGTPTMEEGVFLKFQQAIDRALDYHVWDVATGQMKRGGATVKKVRDFAASSKALSNPLQFLKRVTFETRMAFFNVRQLFVQSGGMFIPATAHPIEAGAAIPEFLHLRLATTVNAGNLDEWANAAKAFGMNPKKMKAMLQAWFKSGIPDSITENADFGLYQGTHGAYYSRRMLNDAVNMSRVFYNAGELNNRAFAFVMAFKRLSKQKNWDLTKNLNDSQIAEVVQEALRLGTNLGPTNASKVQNHWLTGLKTQFWQQWHKYAETLIYGLAGDGAKAKGLVKENQWTRKEALTAIATNLIFFGSAGFGLDEWMSNYDGWLLEQLKGRGYEGENLKEAFTALRGGALEWLGLQTLGWTPDASDSFGPASGVMLKEAVGGLVDVLKGSADADVLELFIGASANVGNGIFRAGGRALDLVAADSSSLEWDATTLYGVATEAMRMTSSGSNLEQARLWLQINDIASSLKNPSDMYIVEDGERIPITVAIARAAGFDPLAREIKMAVINKDKKSKKELADRAKNIHTAMSRYFAQGGGLASEMDREYNKRLASFYMADLSSYERAKVEEEVAKRFAEQGIDSLTMKLMDEFLKQDMDTEKAREAVRNMDLNEIANIEGR